MNVKIKKLCADAVIPKYAKDGDAGLDLVSTSRYSDANGQITHGTGLAVEIPDGFVGFIFPRSSIAKTNMSLCNAVAVIDSSYRGELILKFNVHNPSNNMVLYKVGERIGQLVIMPYPKITLVEVDELSTTDRGVGGFGSSGS